MKESYSKEEVKQLIGSLMDQIEYLHYQYLKCRTHISAPWWDRLSKIEFLKRCVWDDDHSNTMIFNLAKFAEEHPREFEFLKEFYDKSLQKIIKYETKFNENN